MLIPASKVIEHLKSRNIQIKGVLHIGAHDCEELDFYKQLGLGSDKVIWIDALQRKVDEAKARGIPNVFQAVITDKDDQTVTFHLTNNVQSSSVLDFGSHATHHPHVHFTEDMQLKTVTIDTFFLRNGLNVTDCEFWNFDIQGAEMLALQGGRIALEFPKAIYLEVNTEEVYKGCAKMDEIDAFLKTRGFERVETKLYTEFGWGDALYVRSQEKIYFDIGANVGAWALANVNNCDKIISIEAAPSTFSRLVKNNHAKIIPLNYAVCDNNGKDIVFFNCLSADTISTLNKSWLTDESSRFNNATYEEIICKTITINDLIKQYGQPELIKVDTEGGEYECIKSLTQKVNNLCFEWASEFNHITFQCLDHLFALGFTEFSIQTEDSYTYRPTEYKVITDVKEQLSNTVPKRDWGMIWCK